MPPVYDPFSGGGSIPLEAQRLGLPAFGSDLNPVAVMIGKAMIEIPPKFKDHKPIHPGIPERNHYRNAEGLAEDVKYYGEWMLAKDLQPCVECGEDSFAFAGHLDLVLDCDFYRSRQYAKGNTCEYSPETPHERHSPGCRKAGPGHPRPPEAAG